MGSSRPSSRIASVRPWTVGRRALRRRSQRYLQHALVAGLSVVGLVVCNSAALPPQARANGVSDDRVSLPDGPGSIAGIGENLEVDPNMGQMRYSVPLALPEGFPAATPSLSLSYSSGNGQSVVGIGWSLPTPSIERETRRGLPRYDGDDRFSASGEELVHVGDGRYRARFEKDFVRYTFHDDEGSGAAGYWEAESPDGTRMFYGADAAGNPLSDARLEQDGHTFSYQLVETVDVHGHHLRYGYDKLEGNVPLLSSIAYVFRGDDGRSNARYTVELDYEPRADIISDAMPGFEARTAYRLTAVRSYSNRDAIARVSLVYEDYVSSGGVSRLISVRTYGAEDTLYPAVQSFAYSRSVSAVCERCDAPVLVDMGSPGSAAASMASGSASLVDMDGNGLPDLVISASGDNQHTFFMSELDDALTPRFGGGITSAVAAANNRFQLATASIQAFDINGDGLTDIYDRVGGHALCNDASGEWVMDGDCLPHGTDADMTGSDFVDDDDDAPADDDSAQDPDPAGISFLDYDNDKRMDFIRTNDAERATVYRNTEAGFIPQAVDGLGFVFTSDLSDFSPQLADVNGDGLADPVEVQLSAGAMTLNYRLNLGYGHFVDMPQEVLDAGDLQNARVSLEDLNGDGLDDVVAVVSDEVHFALNRYPSGFDDFAVISSDPMADIHVSGLPAYIPGNGTVLFADMNGSGSTDILWVLGDQSGSDAGKVIFLELFPVRPNLISRIENGLGRVQTVAYGTAAEQQSRDGGWELRLRQPMNVVTRRDLWVTLTGGDGGEGLHEVTDYRYHEGFYDGIEKAFRGFQTVEVELLGSDSQEGALTEMTFDLGIELPARNGLPLSSRVIADPGGQDERVLSASRNTYDHCELAGLPDQLADPRFGIDFVCHTADEQDVVEGDASSSVTTRSERSYDGYGNVTRSAELGVVARAGHDCGSDCEGDELYTETSFIAPGASEAHPWLLGLPEREVTYGADKDLRGERRYYYDGPAFEGLPAGEVDKGLLTRMTEAADSDHVVARTRVAFDVHGNVIDKLDPMGDPDDRSGHRRSYDMDADGLKVSRVTAFNSGPDGDYQLRREVTYHTVFNLPVEATAWMVVKDGEPKSARDPVFYRYDEFKRLTAVVLPGDSMEAPSKSISWNLGPVVSTIVTAERSAAGEDADIVKTACYDGMGRQYQSRAAVGDGSYLVSGFTEFNNRGEAVRVYQPYVSDEGACDMTAPGSGVLSTTTRYDGLGRVLAVTEPDADLYGAPSVERTRYAPLATLHFDAEDSDPDSPHYNTPTVERTDGLGRLIEATRYLDDYAETEGQSTRVEYDGLGRMIAVVDPDGNRKEADYDLLGRTLEVRDPNTGATRYEYDDAGNLLARTDARGVRLERDYDGLNRLTAEQADGGGRVEYLFDWAVKACDDKSCGRAPGNLMGTRFVLADGSEAGRAYGYDARGLPVYERLDVLGHGFETRRSYDDAGRLLRTVMPDGQETTRTYDGLGRLVSLPGAIERYEYDRRGLLTGQQYENGARSEFGYDARMRMQHLAQLAGDGEAMADLGFTRNRVSRLVDIDDAGQAATAASMAFVYDDWYRPTQASIMGGALPDEVIDYRYDAIDNVIARSSSLGEDSRAHLGALSYGKDGAGPNAVSQAGGVSRRYDAAGHVSERGQAQLAWDFRGQLERLSEGKAERTFSYDEGGRRVLTTDGAGISIFVSPEFEVHDGIGVRYVRDGQMRLLRAESDALATRLYPDGDEDGRITAHDGFLSRKDAAVSEGCVRSAARRNLMQARDGQTFLHGDHNHSLTAATDADGAVVATRGYYPNGQLRAQTGYVDSYGFTGQPEIGGTGLVQYHHRVFDTQSGRWLSADPKFAELSPAVLTNYGQGNSAYAYIGNAGVNGFDPDGLDGGPKPARRGSTGAMAAKKGGSARRSSSASPSKSSASSKPSHKASGPSPSSSAKKLGGKSGASEAGRSRSKSIGMGALGQSGAKGSESARKRASSVPSSDAAKRKSGLSASSESQSVKPPAAGNAGQAGASEASHDSASSQSPADSASDPSVPEDVDMGAGEDEDKKPVTKKMRALTVVMAVVAASSQVMGGAIGAIKSDIEEDGNLDWDKLP